MTHAFSKTSRIGIDQVRCLAHGFHTTSQDDIAVSGLDTKVGETDGTHTRSTDLIDGGRLTGIGQTGFKKSLPGRNLTTTSLDYLTDNYFVNDSAIHLVSLNQSL